MSTALDHFKNHAIGYGFVVAGFILALAWRGSVAYLDGRHVMNEAHTQSVKTFTKGQRDILKIYQTTELEGQLRAVKKELSGARRERRRFEAYLSADPGSALASARQQTVNELGDEVEELVEEREEILTKQRAAASQ
jgi:hypothetical protein